MKNNFLCIYKIGLEEMSTKHGGMEHVALVTFGAQTRCLQRYTNDFSLIRSAFSKTFLYQNLYIIEIHFLMKYFYM